MATTAFDDGVLVGLLIGEGHFGGDGRQPQITLRMHERHEAMFRWLERTYPGGRLYGPYSHGGRRYYQWMVRGAYLRETIAPLIARRLSPALNRYAHARFVTMCTQYARQLAVDDPRADPGEGAPNPGERPPRPGEGPPSDAGGTGNAAPDADSPSRAAQIFSALRAADPAGPDR